MKFLCSILIELFVGFFVVVCFCLMLNCVSFLYILNTEFLSDTLLTFSVQ